jgi:hypothetical protein
MTDSEGKCDKRDHKRSQAVLTSSCRISRSELALLMLLCLTCEGKSELIYRTDRKPDT